MAPAPRPAARGRRVTASKFSDAQRAELGQRLRARWQDPDYRARMTAASRARMVAMRQDPDFLAKAAAGTRRNRQTPEYRARASAHFSAYYADPENRARHAELSRERLQDPALRARVVAGALKGNVSRCGIFWCPPDLRADYRKLRDSLGLELARAEIRRTVEAIAMAGVDYAGQGSKTA